MKLSYKEVTAFMTDVQHDNVEAVRNWIEQGLEPEKKLADEYPYSPMQMAALLGAIQVMRYLIERGVNVNKGVRNWTPLMEAVENRKHEAVRVLLDAGADPNLRSGADDEGDSKMTALMLAAETRDLEMVQMLLEAGADPKVLSNKGRSAINFAINGHAKGRMEMVKMLIEADTPATGACLVWPAEDADLELTRALLAAGANPNEPSNKYEQTPSGPGILPIHLAIMARWMSDMFKETAIAMGTYDPQKNYRYLEVLRELIKAGADVNLQSKGLWRLREGSLKDDPEAYEILTGAGWQGPENPAPAAEPKAEVKAPKLKTLEEPVQDKLTGALDFLKFVFQGHPEWSVLAVEAPIDSTAEAFAKYRKARNWIQNVPMKSLGKQDAPPVDETPVVQLEGSQWTVLIRSIFDISAVEIAGVPQEAQALSEELKTRAVTFMGEDTSGAMGYEIYENGTRVERADWDGSGNILNFESKMREQPNWPKDDFKIADIVFKELGIYLPICFAEADGEKSWVAVDKKIKQHIRRADLVNV